MAEKEICYFTIEPQQTSGQQELEITVKEIVHEFKLKIEFLNKAKSFIT